MKYQQGDVLFIKCYDGKIEHSNNEDNSFIRLGQYSKASKNDDPVDGKTTIALGEVTGHSHTFYENDNSDAVINTYGISPTIKGLGDVPMFVEVKASPEKFATLRHEEHNKLELPSGLYKTRIVREFDHLSQTTRNVVD